MILPPGYKLIHTNFILINSYHILSLSGKYIQGRCHDTDGIICANCYNWLNNDLTSCPECGTSLIFDGSEKNIIDRIQPNCLIHRYNGSDMLEAAVIIKTGKVNVKVATKLKEYYSPITVPKTKVYMFDHQLFSSIQSLRNERTAVINRYDKLIENHWKKLKIYCQ